MGAKPQDNVRNGQPFDAGRVLCIVSREACLEAADRIDTLEIALRDVIGMLDDPTGSEHVRDMRGAAVIARAALKPNNI